MSGFSRTLEHSVALAIEIDSTRFQFEPRNNGAVFADQIELSYFSLDERGKPLRGERRELELSLRPDTYQRARQAGLRINERIALAPGRYQLRIGVREAGAGTLGTVFYDLQVPDFAREPLSMSGLLVTAGSSPLVPTLVADKAIGSQMLPGPATSRRTFAQGDMLAFYAEIYDNIPARQTHSLEIVARLISEDGRAVFTSRETHDGAALQGAGNSSTLSFAKQIPLDDVPPGRYLLQVETTARGNARDVKSIARETLVSVVPAAPR